MPTIGRLFLLNGVAAGLGCLMLTTRLRTLAALGGIAVSAGALVSLAIARFASSGLFDYVEPTFRGPVAISVAAEVIAIVFLAAYLAVRTRSSAEGGARAGRPKRTILTLAGLVELRAAAGLARRGSARFISKLPMRAICFSHVMTPALSLFVP